MPIKLWWIESNRIWIDWIELWIRAREKGREIPKASVWADQHVSWHTVLVCKLHPKGQNHISLACYKKIIKRGKWKIMNHRQRFLTALKTDSWPWVSLQHLKLICVKLKTVVSREKQLGHFISTTAYIALWISNNQYHKQSICNILER